MADKVHENKDWVTLLNLAGKIKHPELRDFTLTFLEDVVPDYFARIAASASGKYHPQYSLGYGGLLRHTIAAAVLAKELAALEYWQFSPGEQELIFAATILHDTFKQGKEESGKTERSHPNIAAIEIRKFAEKRGDQKFGNLLAGLVVAHMGQWGNQKPGNKGQFCVHLADFIASRRNVEVHWDEEFLSSIK